MGDDEQDSLAWTYRWGAKIALPNDCPDDIGADAVKETTKAITEVTESGGTWEENGLEACKKIKAFFDKKYDGSWHVFIGKNFGAHVTHQSRTFIYFYFTDLTFFDKATMIFKA